MNGYKYLFLLLILLTNTFNIHAAESWKCYARDGAEKEWSAQGTHARMAVNLAFEFCKKQSTVPSSCKTSKEECEYFTDGLSSRPMWQCTALDQMAKPWRSAVYPKRDDAALGAKAFCQEQSGTPETCYINLLTCHNLNEQE